MLTCPKCRALLETGTKSCPYCEADIRHTAAATPEQEATRTTGLGTWILAVNILVFFLMVQLDPERDDRRGGVGMRPSSYSLVGFGLSDPRLIRECGQPWRVVSANFLHLDLLHLVFNSIAILFLIPLAAVTFGPDRTLAIYFLAGVAGFLLSQAMGNKSAGASAALCGMIGALAVYGKRRGAPDLTRRMMMWAGFVLIIGLVSGSTRFLPAMDNWGHFGGFLAGVALAWPASTVRARGSGEDRLWRASAIACIASALAVAGAFVLPSVLRIRESREVGLYHADAKKLLGHLSEVQLGRRERGSLPETFAVGPGRSGRMTAAVRAALAKTRGGDAGAGAALRKAELAWSAWRQGLYCSYYKEFS